MGAKSSVEEGRVRAISSPRRGGAAFIGVSASDHGIHRGGSNYNVHKLRFDERGETGLPGASSSLNTSARSTVMRRSKADGRSGLQQKKLRGTGVILYEEQLTVERAGTPAPSASLPKSTAAVICVEAGSASVSVGRPVVLYGTAPFEVASAPIAHFNNHHNSFGASNNNIVTSLPDGAPTNASSSINHPKLSSMTMSSRRSVGLNRAAVTQAGQSLNTCASLPSQSKLLGTKTNNTDIKKKKQVVVDELQCLTGLAYHSVVQIACGHAHVLFLDSLGIVLGLGKNDLGQLGLPLSVSKVVTPQHVHLLRDANIRCTKVAAGC